MRNRAPHPIAATALALLASGCPEAALDGPGQCLDNPSGILFCDDRVDDNCDGEGEVCPATQPADAPPAFDCTGTPPDNVFAHASLPTNAQVAGGCVFIYQAESGAFYASVDVRDGSNPQGPMGESVGLCAYDYGARKHLFFTTAPVSECADIAYVYPDQVANQLLSNDCRKMVRNLVRDDPSFEPDIQFLPGNVDDQRARIETFSVAEVACLRINNASGAPYRPDELFVTQAEASFVENAGFVAR